MIKSILSFVIFAMGNWAFAQSMVKAGQPKLSCGVIRLKDDEWVKKPTQVPISKAGVGFTLYEKDGLNIGAILDRDSLILSANFRKKLIAVVVTEGSSNPIQIALPETGLQILCNSEKQLLKVTLPQ